MWFIDISILNVKCHALVSSVVHSTLRGKELHTFVNAIYSDPYVSEYLVDCYSLKLDSTESVFLLWHSSIAFYKYISSHGSLYLKTLLNPSLRHQLSIGTQYCHHSRSSFHYSSLWFETKERINLGQPIQFHCQTSHCLSEILRIPQARNCM